jgi:glycosyltransferase involved in cell wall biosynthesis
MFGQSAFNTEILIPTECNVVFVADLFEEDYPGGAEKTTQALIDSAPKDVNIFKIRARNITQKTLESGYNKFWVFGNFSTMNPNLFPTIVKNLKYSVLEYDYKFCKHRSIEKHAKATGSSCDCHNEIHGKIVSAFFHGANSVYWMSERQLDRYTERYPFLLDSNEGSRQIVLSSVFKESTFFKIQELKEKYKEKNGKYIVLGSDSWIKGKDKAIEYCISNNLEYEIVWGKSYEETLELLAQSTGFVYLPLGGDTCPRMVLEAQMLGCELRINNNVQHHEEFPFTGGEDEDVIIYLSGRAEHFWMSTIDDMDWYPRISGYTTTYNCISQKYPFAESIMSMSSFCEEIIVMDGGSSDGTYEALLKLAEEEPKIKVHQHKVDWNSKRSAVEDGGQKARARERCTQKYCWQMDVDEIVHEDHYRQIHMLCRQFPKFVDLVSLPVVEYWGTINKVRMDINPWKWRLSRNKSFITHGIPKQLRKYDEDNNLYASLGTDGCDYIHKENGELIPHASFYTPEIHELRLNAIEGDKDALANYSIYFNNMINKVPGVFHYSWFDIERKIKTYRDFWQRHWESLFDIKQEDTAENNMFFDKSWSEVTDNDISSLAVRLSEEMGGWIFHAKVDFNNPSPHISITMKQPGIMNGKATNTSRNLQLQP